MTTEREQAQGIDGELVRVPHIYEDPTYLLKRLGALSGKHKNPDNPEFTKWLMKEWEDLKVGLSESVLDSSNVSGSAVAFRKLMGQAYRSNDGELRVDVLSYFNETVNRQTNFIFFADNNNNLTRLEIRDYVNPFDRNRTIKGFEVELSKKGTVKVKKIKIEKVTLGK